MTAPGVQGAAVNGGTMTAPGVSGQVAASSGVTGQGHQGAVVGKVQVTATPLRIPSVTASGAAAATAQSAAASDKVDHHGAKPAVLVTTPSAGQLTPMSNLVYFPGVAQGQYLLQHGLSGMPGMSGMSGIGGINHQMSPPPSISGISGVDLQFDGGNSVLSNGRLSSIAGHIASDINNVKSAIAVPAVMVPKNYGHTQVPHHTFCASFRAAGCLTLGRM